MIHVVSNFAVNYLGRGLAMIESISRYEGSDIKFTILGMDSKTSNYLRALSLPNVAVINIDDFDDKEFQSLRKTRSFRELCWTAASCLTHHIYKTDSDSDFIIYVDADCFFFSSISNLAKSWNRNSNIFIHEHRYSVNRKQWESSSGRFNVGVVGFRAKSNEALSCLSKWRSQVIDVCELNPELGYCGDQGYLNDWPDRYPSLHIMESKGEGAAPWNVEHSISQKRDDLIFVDGEKLIFYHFHSLRISIVAPIKMFIIRMSFGYQIPTSVRSTIYLPYVKSLVSQTRRLLKSGYSLEELGCTRFPIRSRPETVDWSQVIFKIKT